MTHNEIYRPFFKSAIIFTLTAGTAWGVYLLWQIGQAGSFTGVSLHFINAHGHAQVFGWVGLFIMGFALQILPRFRHTNLWRPLLARPILILMGTGIVARVVGGYFHESSWGLSLGIVGSVCEITAVGMFFVVIIKTLRQSISSFTVSDWYIALSAFWFSVATIFSAVHYMLTVSAQSQQDLVTRVATWQGPLRDIQIIGFMLLMILGFSHRIVPTMFPKATWSERASLSALVAINLSLVLSVVAHPVFMMFKWTPALMAQGFSVALLFAAVLGLVIPWRLWSPTPAMPRSVKFVTAAYGWLVISLLLYLLLPLYNRWSEMAFSHAYFGAARHAVTVGFISQMIVGVSSRVVPVLTGADQRSLSRLTIPFWLLNIGCLLRVTLQITSDHIPSVFPVIALSGVFELTALALWGTHLLRLMRSSKERQEETIKTRLPDGPAPVTGSKSRN